MFGAALTGEACGSDVLDLHGPTLILLFDSEKGPVELSSVGVLVSFPSCLLVSL